MKLAITRALVVTVIAAGGVVGLAKASSTAEAISYPNCQALNARYPHGVGRWGAHDHTSGTPVTNFKRSNILYRRNRARDRDHDGIACEKK